MSRKHIFEIPDNPGSVVFYVGREITIDGETIVEVKRDSACARDRLSDWALDYCYKHWFNPVFMHSTGNLPVLIGFVFDESSFFVKLQEHGSGYDCRPLPMFFALG
jgi:hypothetical protein